MDKFPPAAAYGRMSALDPDEHECCGGHGNDMVTLEKLSDDVGVDVRTLRRYMADPAHPMPTHHVCRTGNDRGRVFVSRHEFNAWVRSFAPDRSNAKPVRPKTDFDDRVAAAVRSMRR